MHAKPGKVSILMNCFNGEAYLKEAVDSVINQRYSDWELIFWDNQSTDRSAEIYKSYVDSRLKYYYAPRHTLLYEARNHALDRSTGEFVAFLDVDDWWFPEKLDSQIKLFSDAEVGFVCSNFFVLKKKKIWQAFQSPKPAGSVLNDLLRDYYVGLLTLMVRRSALHSASPIFNPNYHIIGDFDLVTRLATTCKMGVIQEPLAVNRIHGSNESQKNKLRHINELDCWLREACNNPILSGSGHLKYVSDLARYLKVLERLSSGKRLEALKLMLSMQLGRNLFRLVGIFFLPRNLIIALRVRC
jgi:glycosyltransferase involved in cell wall biosynthesis